LSSRTGAASNLAREAVVDAPADGYTLLLGFSKAQLEAALAAGELIKVQSHGDVKEKD
jgi:hypothetical protein